ncbi:MAG: SAF domain-containing protein [Actinomycetaceae bacterium]|nr:SAF domain-containing protein [Actinomycetaceae bacterium]
MSLQHVRVFLWRHRYVLVAVAIIATMSSVVTAIRGLEPATRAVLVTARDIPPGTRLSSGDVATARVPAKLVPPGVSHAPVEVEGQTLVTPVAEGVPIIPEMLLSEEFMSSVEPGHVVVPVTVQTDGTEELLTPGRTVALYAPPDEYSQSRAAEKIVERAQIVGVGKESEDLSFSSDSPNTRPLFLAVPVTAASLVIGYGSTMPMRVVVVK